MLAHSPFSVGSGAEWVWEKLSMTWAGSVPNAAAICWRTASANGTVSPRLSMAARQYV